MKHALVKGRGVIVFVLPLAAGLVSLAAAGWAWHSHSAASRNRAAEAAAADRPTPIVVCLGMADLDGGALSLQPTVPGRVAEVAVVENQTVSAGAILIKLDDEAARAQVQEAEAALRASESQLALARKAPAQHRLLLRQQEGAVNAARHELSAARLLFSRQEELVRKELSNRKEADAAAERVSKLEAMADAEQAKLDALALRDPGENVRRAEADVDAKRAMLERARHVLHEHGLRAPSNGAVLRVLTGAGETIGPSRPSILFAADKPRIVRAEVDQEFVGRVIVGQRAEIEDDAVADGVIRTGRVTRTAEWFANRRSILPETPIFQDVRTLECVIQLDEGQPILRIGQRVRVKLYER